MKKILVICGPTATGKTSLGLYLAKKFNGEIVSADSRQVYKGMDIGTGKDINKQISKSISNKQISNDKYQIGYYLVNEAKIWLYDVVKPEYRFNAADYVKCAGMVIEDIWQRGKLPILVGGTGFYIKALVDGIESLGVPPDWKLRARLSNYSILQLSDLLKKVDPQRWGKMNESDRKNPRRLIRAIEIAFPKDIKKKTLVHFNTLAYWSKGLDVLMVGLKMPLTLLYQRIDKRVEDRVKMGIEEEIEKLFDKGYSFVNSALGATIGYKEWKDYFKTTNNKQQTIKLKEEIIQRWKFNEHGYARRQMTWFKKQKNIYWFDIQAPTWQKAVEETVERWYNPNS